MWTAFEYEARFALRDYNMNAYAYATVVGAYTCKAGEGAKQGVPSMHNIPQT